MDEWTRPELVNHWVDADGRVHVGGRDGPVVVFVLPKDYRPSGLLRGDAAPEQESDR